MKDNIAVSVREIKKDFILPHESNNSLKRKITSVFRKKDRGFEIQHALKGVSFEVKKGEFFGIVGRNGSGKSTLLKIIAEIYKPTSGSINIEGKLVPFIELGVGFNPELTGRENVFLNGALLGFSKKETEDIYDDIVRFAELEDFMDQKLKNYSSGMQVRLAFSVATRAKADVLLVDEVLAVGDADFQRKCFDYFKQLKKNKKTVIFVTHSMDAVREYCDRAILIQDGVIKCEGDANKVSNEYTKLFNVNIAKEESKETKDDKDSKRWGNGQVKTEKASVKAVSDSIVISLDIKSNNVGAEDFIIDYKFTDNEGGVVMGGSSLYCENGKKLNIKPNSQKTIKFKMDNVLGGGTYKLDVVIKLSDKITICDNWDEAAEIKLTKKEIPYPVIAPAKMEVIDE